MNAASARITNAAEGLPRRRFTSGRLNEPLGARPEALSVSTFIRFPGSPRKTPSSPPFPRGASNATTAPPSAMFWRLLLNSSRNSDFASPSSSSLAVSSRRYSASGNTANR